MDENPPAKAGGHGFNPRSGKIPCAEKQLSPEPHLLKAVPRACAPQQERPPQLGQRVPLLSETRAASSNDTVQWFWRGVGKKLKCVCKIIGVFQRGENKYQNKH